MDTNQQYRALRHGGVPERYLYPLINFEDADDLWRMLLAMNCMPVVADAYAYGYIAPTAAKWVLIRLGGLSHTASQLVVELSADRTNATIELPWSHTETSGDEITTVTVRQSA